MSGVVIVSMILGNLCQANCDLVIDAHKIAPPEGLAIGRQCNVRWQIVRKRQDAALAQILYLGQWQCRLRQFNRDGDGLHVSYLGHRNLRCLNAVKVRFQNKALLLLLR